MRTLTTQNIASEILEQYPGLLSEAQVKAFRDGLAKNIVYCKEVTSVDEMLSGESMVTLGDFDRVGGLPIPEGGDWAAGNDAAEKLAAAIMELKSTKLWDRVKDASSHAEIRELLDTKVFQRNSLPADLKLLTDRATREVFRGRQADCLNTSKGKQSKTQYVTIDGLSGILGAFDKSVFSAVLTLYLDDPEGLVTPHMVYRIMSGGKNDDNLTTLRSIRSSIIRMRSESITITASETEKDAYQLGSCRLCDCVLPGRYIEYAELNGSKTDGIVLDRAPALYMYAQHKRIETVRRELLRVPGTKFSERFVVLRDELFLRVRNKKQDRVCFESLHELAGVAGKSEKQNVRKLVYKILDHFSNEGHISGYDKDGTTAITLRRN